MQVHKQTYFWLIPLLFMALIAPLTLLIDPQLSKMAFEKGGSAFPSHALLDFFYDYGVIPGQLLIMASLAALLLSYTVKRCKTWRPHALYLLLTLAIGAGFISHALLKDHWGRPRPKQVIEFGGQQPFRPFWQPQFTGQPEPSKSFPCGHCTMGFAFFSFYFLGRRLKKPLISLSGLVIAIALGSALGMTRIIQGGHFFSDVLMSALIMWLTAYAFDWLIYENAALTQEKIS
jgi:lipid A 4'-phosphatase